MFLAQKAGKVYGVEIVPQAIEDAKRNAALNGITNAQFFVGKAEEVLPEFYAKGDMSHPDVIVVDPPRKGVSMDVIEAMAERTPARIVYVSCDPATLARDVKLLTQRGYRFVKAEAFDLFPRCAHVETVCLLSKPNAGQRF